MCVSVCSKDWLTVSMCVCRSKDEHWENVNLFRVSFLSAWILSTNSLGKCLHTNDTLTVSQLVLNTQSMIVSLMCRIVRVYIFFTSNFSIDPSITFNIFSLNLNYWKMDSQNDSESDGVCLHSNHCFIFWEFNHNCLAYNSISIEWVVIWSRKIEMFCLFSLQ